jgi:hypothetical protein
MNDLFVWEQNLSWLKIIYNINNVDNILIIYKSVVVDNIYNNIKYFYILFNGYNNINKNI